MSTRILDAVHSIESVILEEAVVETRSTLTEDSTPPPVVTADLVRELDSAAIALTECATQLSEIGATAPEIAEQAQRVADYASVSATRLQQIAKVTEDRIKDKA